MEVIVKDGKDELNKALKQFTKMVKKSEIMQELKNREHFLKPSKKHRFFYTYKKIILPHYSGIFLFKKKGSDKWPQFKLLQPLS